MFILISSVTLAFSTGGLFILQYAYNAYNEEIYRQSAQSLGVSISSIENELRKMEGLSFQVTTDLLIHNYLRMLNNDPSDYERFMSSSEIRKRLLDVGALNQYVHSFQIYDNYDRELASGNQIVAVGDERLLRMKEEAANQNGGITWILPDEEDQTLVIAREIRSYSPLRLTLQTLGLSTIRLDIESLVDNFSNSMREKGADLMIINEDGEFIYPITPPFSDQFISKSIDGREGYHLIKEDGERYFVTYNQAQHTNWTYMIVTPYSNLFEVISVVRNAVIVTYSLLFIVILFLGMRFIRSITNPIEHLNLKMKSVQSGDYDQLDDHTDLKFSNDELGQMHENFKQMMDQIEFLMSENYKKVTIIKETEYKVLQAQVNPHFLYNTLDTINWEAKVNGHYRISKMAESLGYILRSSINVKESLIPLENEMKIVESYQTIQSYRFEERLDFHMDISEDLYTCHVPKFMLQPLVDNSIRYGLQKMIGTCTILVSVHQDGDHLIFTVEDNGVGIENELLQKIVSWDYESQGNGIGLKNIQHRIQTLFGQEFGISIDSEVGKGTTVRIRLPVIRGDHNVQSAIGR